MHVCYNSAPSVEEATLLRRKDPETIKRDAIKMAIKKGASGCFSCAETYFALARENGATDEDIRSAIEGSSTAGLSLFSRRQILQLGLGAAGALVLGSMLRSPSRALATCEPYSGSTWWGSHNLSHLVSGKPPQDFYIFTAGGGLDAPGSGNFDLTAAKNAGSYNTFLYWSMNGSQEKGSYSAYNYGEAQADAALRAWYDTSISYSGHLNGPTILGEVILDNPGWTGNHYSMNEDVLNGWLDTMSGETFYNGIYTGSLDWYTAFGSSGYAPSGGRYFSLWLSPSCWSCCDSSVSNIPCAPCDTTCTETECDVGIYLTMVAPAAIAKQHPSIWHYWYQNSACAPLCNGAPNGSFDVALTSPALGFPNRSSSTGFIDCPDTGGCGSSENFSACP